LLPPPAMARLESLMCVASFRLLPPPWAPPPPPPLPPFCLLPFACPFCAFLCWTLDPSLLESASSRTTREPLGGMIKEVVVESLGSNWFPIYFVVPINLRSSQVDSSRVELNRVLFSPSPSAVPIQFSRQRVWLTCPSGPVMAVIYQ